MCKHILNAQVSIRAPCCKQWFDCAECHAEKTDHELMKVYEMVFACKKCKKVFRKDYREWDETDEFCPHCDNKFVLPAKKREEVSMITFEGSTDMIRDERQKPRGNGGMIDFSQFS